MELFGERLSRFFDEAAILCSLQKLAIGHVLVGCGEVGLAVHRML